MKHGIFLLAIGVLILFVAGCQGPTNPDEKDVTLTGQVVDKATNNPLEGAVVQVLDVSPEMVQITDSEGKFSFEIKVEKSQDIRVVARKEDYYPDTTTVLVVPGRTIPDFTLKLNPAVQLVRLSGQVVNKLTNNPIDSAVVRVLNISPEVVQITDSEGKFNMEVPVETTLDIKVVAFKEGYLPDTTTVLAVPGRTITVPSLKLTPGGQILT
ncbi:MAG: carboxypeptidase-like regulatory domain-containing protein, partial [candidate division KSB1 bacterium]|nr:carboxypeptidase-like regulatory domain-containing protein [candidate division KSB1 bacterium]